MCSAKIARGIIDSAKKHYSVKGMWDHLKSTHDAEFRSSAGTAREELVKKKQRLDEEPRAAKAQLYQLQSVQPSASIEMSWVEI